MFSRKQKKKALTKMQDFVWPRIGWKRWFAYLKHRVGRLPGTPHGIAAGFAFGAAISFTPLMGFHILLSALMAKMCRGSMVAAALGTIVGNPLTFPFIWVGIYNLGLAILGHSGTGVDFNNFMEGAGHLSVFHPSSFITFVSDNFHNIFVPMFVGGIPAFLVVWPLFYFPLKKAIKSYQERRHVRRRNRMVRKVTQEEIIS